MNRFHFFTGLIFCLGIASLGRADVPASWTDVTANEDGTLGCNGLGDCSFRDIQSGLEWTKGLEWDASYFDAELRCKDSHYNGKTGWRVPTKDEAAFAVKHGINAIEVTGFYPARFREFWTSSIVVGEPGVSWTFIFGNASSLKRDRTDWIGAICVRP
jgi:hypothetical protein